MNGIYRTSNAPMFLLFVNLFYLSSCTTSLSVNLDLFVGRKYEDVKEHLREPVTSTMVGDYTVNTYEIKEKDCRYEYSINKEGFITGYNILDEENCIVDINWGGPW